MNNKILFMFPLLMGPYAAAQPNVILIMADDMGWGDVGFNGNDWIHTPCLDRMAGEGIVLSNFRSASALSSPTRASVLTGRNPFRTGVFSANVGILRPEENTIAEVLKSEDYRTGHFGKWHLGSLTCTEKDANRGKPGNLKDYNPPALHGYDVAFVTESKVPTWDPMKKPVSETELKWWDALSPTDSSQSYGTSYWNIDGEKVTENLDGDDSRVIMDRVIDFIGTSKDHPFLAVVWFHAPHLPCVAGPQYAALYKDYETGKRNYAGCITALDEQIGRLTDYLKDNGIASNTVVFFCSDNGPEVGTPGDAGRFRDRKRSLHEGGVRVPSLAWWPGHISPGVSDCQCSTLDYFPTILSLTHAGEPANALDGKSIANVLLNEGNAANRPLDIMLGEQTARIDGRYKLYSKKGVYELYDLENDPYEQHNISAEASNRLEQMKSGLDSTINSCRNSFEGREYGDESLKKTGQKWPLKK